jgi:outer membrane protein OmpA-like peptidoglycan-associated protein
MVPRTWISLGLAGMVMATPAFAQSYSADELATILRPGPGTPSFSADEFAAILKPGGPGMGQTVRTRSLRAGQGPGATGDGAAAGVTASAGPGAAGSGVVPDLKIQFGLNSAELTRGAKATLDELGKALQRDDLRTLRFRVAGHTDAKGSDKANEELSRKRAASVVAYLRQGFGIEAERLEAVGYGEKELMDWKNPNNSANRRVEVRTMN